MRRLQGLHSGRLWREWCRTPCGAKRVPHEPIRRADQAAWDAAVPWSARHLNVSTAAAKRNGGGRRPLPRRELFPEDRDAQWWAKKRWLDTARVVADPWKGLTPVRAPGPASEPTPPQLQPAGPVDHLNQPVNSADDVAPNEDDPEPQAAPHDAQTAPAAHAESSLVREAPRSQPATPDTTGESPVHQPQPPPRAAGGPQAPSAAAHSLSSDDSAATSDIQSQHASTGAPALQASELVEALHLLSTLIAHQSGDTADPDLPRLTRRHTREPSTAAPALTGTASVVQEYHGGLAPAEQRVHDMQAWPGSQLATLTLLEPGSPAARSLRTAAVEARRRAGRSVQGRMGREGEPRRAQPTSAELAQRLAEVQPQWFVQPANEPAGSRAARSEPDTASCGELQAEVAGALARAGVAEPVEAALLPGILQMVAAGCFDNGSVNGGRAAVVRLEEWVQGVEALERAHPPLAVLSALPAHHHLMLRTPRQLSASLAALAELMGPSRAALAPVVASAQPHLLYKSPRHLTDDVDDMMDITRLPEPHIIDAIVADPAVLSLHEPRLRLMTWAHLERAVAPSAAWRGQLRGLQGADLAAALLATHGVLDGLQYMQDRGQDAAMDLGQALRVSAAGLGRRFRRYKQRHLLMAEWRLVEGLLGGAPARTAPAEHTQGNHPERDEVLAGLSPLAKQCVLAELAQQQEAAALAQAEAAHHQRQADLLHVSAQLVMQHVSGGIAET